MDTPRRTPMLEVLMGSSPLIRIFFDSGLHLFAPFPLASSSPSPYHHRHMAWGVQGGRTGLRPRPASWQNLKRLIRPFYGQGIEGLGMAGRSNNLGSPWPPLAIRLCLSPPPPPSSRTVIPPFSLSLSLSLSLPHPYLLAIN
jgi:hypothetical protein